MKKTALKGYKIIYSIKWYFLEILLFLYQCQMHEMEFKLYKMLRKAKNTALDQIPCKKKKYHRKREKNVFHVLESENFINFHKNHATFVESHCFWNIVQNEKKLQCCIDLMQSGLWLGNTLKIFVVHSEKWKFTSKYQDNRAV